MAKLVALVILLVALAAATSASARRESSCEMEMEEMMPMKKCMMWMQAKMRSPRYRSEQGTLLEDCCSELMEFSSPCRCEAVKDMMMDMQSYGEMEKMEKMACSLPRMCGMSQQCHSCSRRDVSA